MSLPGLRFRLFGVPVTIGIDFLFIAVLFGLQARGQPEYLVEWVLVLATAILLHEFGHAFALRRYGIHPSIRLWGLGGLTTFGFALPSGKAILVSAAGPAIGIAAGVVLLILQPWLDGAPLLLQVAVSDAILVCLGWGIVNLLPIAGLDGGNITEHLFLLALGPRGRRPGLIVVAVASIVIAVGAALIGLLYLTLLIAFFALMSPAAYQELWRLVAGDRGFAGWGGWRGFSAPAVPRVGTSRPAGPRPRRLSWHGPQEKRQHPRGTGLGPDVRHRFGEIYAEVFGETVDLDELESRPEPLLSDVAVQLRTHDDAAVASRLALEPDPLTVLAMAARMLDAERARAVLDLLRSRQNVRPDANDTKRLALLRLQVAFHALGRYDYALSAGQEIGHDAPVESVLLLARSAARHGDRKRAREELDRAVRLGLGDVSDDVLGDLARIGPDEQVAVLLARLRREHSR